MQTLDSTLCSLHLMDHALTPGCENTTTFYTTILHYQLFQLMFFKLMFTFAFCLLFILEC